MFGNSHVSTALTVRAGPTKLTLSNQSREGGVGRSFAGLGEPSRDRCGVQLVGVEVGRFIPTLI